MGRQYRFSAAPLSSALAGLWLLMNAALAASAAGWWYMHAWQAESHAAESIAALRTDLNQTLSFAREELHRLQYDIRRSDGHLETIRSLLAQQSVHAPALLRFAWIDARGMMRVSSAGGIRSDSYNVSDRDYIKRTRAQPFAPVISPILTHRITQQPFFVVAMGIESLSHDYLGTINAVYHLSRLQDWIDARMRDCQCHYIVYAPTGEIVTPHAQDKPVSGTGQFAVAGQVQPRALAAITRRSLLGGGVVLFVANLSFWLAYRMIRRRILRPLDIAHPHKRAGGLAVFDEAEEQIRQIRALGTSYQAMAAQLKETQTHLLGARQMLAQMEQQQSQLGSATRKELHACWQAIGHYADHLDELIAAQVMEPDRRYDYDDVIEMGQNLVRLSEGLERIHAPEGRGGEAVSVALKPLLEACLASQSPAADRRNLTLALTCDAALTVHCDQGALRHVLSCLVSEWVRHSEDEAHLNFSATSGADGVVIACRSSMIRQSMLPMAYRSSAALLPSLPQAQDAGGWLMSQAGVAVASIICTQMGASLSATAQPQPTFAFSLHLPAPLV